MKAARLYEHGGLRIEDVPKPVPGPGDMLVQVEVALAGRSDLNEDPGTRTSRRRRSAENFAAT